MKLSNQDLLLLSEIAISAAKEAGLLISEYSNKKLNIKSKSGGDSLASQVVTEVDVLSQEIILKHILPSCKNYDLGLLTEESTDDNSRFQNDYFWCIDPLDGTLPFAKSNPGYSVSIALVSRSGVPEIGVVFDPVTQTLYHAVKGQGAYRNMEEWNPINGDGNELTLVVDPSFSKHKWYQRTFEKLRSFANISEVIELGGAVMNACWVIEKQPAVYFKFPKPEQGGGSLWDFAATACIYIEAGVIVSDFFGAPLDLNRADSSYMNHRGVIYASNKELANLVRELYKSFAPNA